MRQLRAWSLRLWGFLRRDLHEKELAAELDSHLQMHIEDNLRSGMTPEQARRDALVKLGGMDSTVQQYREQNTIPYVEELIQDVRFATRQLRKNLGFTATAILMLALGVGASVAIFVLVDAALIKPLPYRDPARLVSVYETTDLCPRCNVSYLNFRDFKERENFFSSLDAWGFSTYLLHNPSGTEPVAGARVTDGFFRTLGVTPILGRDFHAAEDAPSAPRTVIISFAAWQNRYASSPSVIGQPVTLGEDAYTIIGVLPREFHFAPRGPAEFWTPLNGPNSCEERRSCHSLFGIARLKDGISIPTALAGMKSIAQQLQGQYPENRGYSADVVPLSETISGKVRPILLVLIGGASLLLLIACLNVSGLLVVRSENRRREVAVRGALGATPARLIRQFMTEGLVLVVLGSGLGLLCASLTVRMLLALIPQGQLESMPYLSQVGLNPRVLSFAGVIAFLATMLFSVTPVLHLSRTSLQPSLATGGRTSAGTTWRRIGSRLVIVELAMAVVLLVAAGLLGKSFYQMLHVDTGLQPDRLATLQITMPGSYNSNEKVDLLEKQIIRRIDTLPGVKSAGISTALPVDNWSITSNIRVLDRPSNGEHNDVPLRNVSSDYLNTLGAKLLRGRYFTEEEDSATRASVVLINQAFANKYFPGEDPIGRRLAYETSHDSMEIIGVIADIKEGPLDSDNRATVYVPFMQGWFRTFSLAVRTSTEETALLPTLGAVIHEIDPGIATKGAASMKDLIDDSQSAYLHRSSAWMVGGFAGLALILGVVGLYGVIAYSVSQRSREIGVRMALGAQRSTVYQLILREAAFLTAAGIGAGLLSSLGATLALGKLLFGVKSWDVATLISVAVVLAAAALLATYIPAHRAASINPAEALRAD